MIEGGVSNTVNRTTTYELAFQECIEVIDANVEEVITNKADSREKKWWIDGNYKIIDENRLPLILIEGVSYEEFEKKCEFANASRCWEFQDGMDTVDCVGSSTCHATPVRITRGSSKQSDSSFVPRLMPKPARSPCDVQGNPWPTIIVEVANSESLSRIMHKTTQFWLAPNRVEDVIIEFGTIDRNNQPYNGCIAVGMCTLNISPLCIFRGCPGIPPYPIANNVIINFFPIQQSIFHAM
ncbi:hypothetical protein C1645_824982 [Glomus cerebriforme]|uniref:Restriction endonuclease domain-containing protein n=1 Tax=Glomus cerebriforme TaxID=658196 RepID=A0A397STB1_9GLOM|nr:hypothetical protein C1645_824982 [Glomus cerebriforme]